MGCLGEALAVAHQQSVGVWELRATAALAPFWRDRGSRVEARDLLERAYHWITEGSETQPLRDARVLLDELNERNRVTSSAEPTGRNMMKLYNWQRAPNCRRVRMFILEKGLEIPPIEEVGGKVRLSDEYIKIWPHALVPMLETDDGLRIGEAMAICRFLEDEYPDPNLMGVDGREKARIEMWERRAYDEGLIGVAEVLRNSHPAFADRGLPGSLQPVPQILALIERGRGRVGRFYRKFDGQLKENRFVAGDRFTVADITALCSIDFAEAVGIKVPDDCLNITRWHREVSTRSAAKASV